MITHANLLFAGDAVARSSPAVRPDDRWLVTLPLSHVNALRLLDDVGALGPARRPRWCRRFDPRRGPGRPADSRLRWPACSPSTCVRILDAPPSVDDATNRLRLTVFAQHLTPDERRVFRGAVRTRAAQVYGLTETIAPTLSDPVYGPAVPGTVGRATPWVHTRLVDASGADVAVGEPGELLVQGVPGRSLMAGYLDREEDTRRILRDGWFRTGDHLRSLPDGSFEFLGRAEEIFKPGVDNVSAAEVERVLLEHVSVREAAVVAVSTPEREEHIVGFVVLRPEDDATEAEVLAWARDRLAAHKVPEHVVAVPALPRNAVGKVLKRQLSEAGGP